MLKVESYKKGIVLSTVFNIFNKALVFLNGVLVVYFFGLSTSTDIFFYAYNSVLIIGAFFSSINSTVIIPESMRVLTQEGKARSMGFLNFFLYLYALIVVLGLIIIAINPPVFFSLASNFKYEHLADNRDLLYFCLPLFAMICIINLMIDILASHKFFTIPMIVGIINGLFSLIFIITLHDVVGIRTVLIGLLTSYTINLILLVIVMKRSLRWKFHIIKYVKEKRIWKNLGFAQLGNITSTVASYTPMYVLSGFSTGIITALTFAQQISSLPTMLITYQFSSVAGVKFNELYAKKEMKEISRVFADAANFLHFIMIPLSCFIFYFADDIVQILLGFTSFKGAESNYVSVFLKYLGFLLPFYVINSLIARLFMASHKIKESFWYQVVFNIVLITCLFFGVKYFGIVGYPLVMVSTYLLNLVCCYFIEKRYFNFVDYGSIMKKFIVLGLVNILISSMVVYMIRLAGVENPFFSVALAGSIYLLLLYMATILLKLNEGLTTQLNGLVKKMF